MSPRLLGVAYSSLPSPLEIFSPEKQAKPHSLLPKPRWEFRGTDGWATPSTICQVFDDAHVLISSYTVNECFPAYQTTFPNTFSQS